MTELILTFDRYFILQKKVNWFTITKQRYICVSILVFSIVLYLPEFYVYKFEYAYNSTYKLKKTEFGMSSYYSYYFILVYSFTVCILMPVYLITTIFVAWRFKEFIQKRQSRFKLKNSRAKNEDNITKFIIITGITYVLSTMVFVAATCLARFEIFKKYYYDIFSILIRFGSLFFVPFIFSLNATLVFFYDTNLKKIFQGKK